MGWMAAAQIGGSLLSDWIGATSAHKANRTNIRLQREQQAWEKEMSDTAIQRRRADFEAAGFNPVLAATGVGASTPSISAATVEPTIRESKGLTGIGTALQLQRQNDLMQAQTSNLSASTRKTNAEARLVEQFGEAERMQGLEKTGTEITRLNKEIEGLGITNNMSAAQLDKFERTKEQMIGIIKNAKSVSDINLTALRNIAEMGGIEMQKAMPFIKLLLSLFLKGDTK